MIEKQETTADVLEDIERRVAEREGLMLAAEPEAIPPVFTYEDVAFLLNLLHGLSATTEAALAPEPSSEMVRLRDENMRLRRELAVRNARLFEWMRNANGAGESTVVEHLRRELKLSVRHGNIMNATLQQLAARVGTLEDAQNYLDAMEQADRDWWGESSYQSLSLDNLVAHHDPNAIPRLPEPT